MELKSVVQSIMKSDELKSKLKNLGSFDEVYDFFVDCGYEGEQSELKDKLFKGSEPFKVLDDDDLMNVAGGISGRQVLSACMGFMMLTGSLPNMMGLNDFGSAKSIGTSVTSTVKKDSEVSHGDILKFGEVMVDRYVSNYIVLMRMSYDESGTHKYGSSFEPESNKMFSWLGFFSMAITLKSEAELFSMESKKDVSGFKSRVDKLLAENDINSFNEEECERKLEAIMEDYPDIRLMSTSEDFNEKFKNLLDKKLSKSEKEGLLKQLKKKLDDVDKKYGEMWLDEEHHVGIKFTQLLLFGGECLGMNMERQDNKKMLLNIMEKEEVKQLQKIASRN